MEKTIQINLDVKLNIHDDKIKLSCKDVECEYGLKTGQFVKLLNANKLKEDLDRIAVDEVTQLDIMFNIVHYLLDK